MTIKQMTRYLIQRTSKEQVAADLYLSVKSIENYLSGRPPLRIVAERIKHLYETETKQNG